MAEMTPKGAASYLGAKVRYGQFRDKDGKLGNKIAFYQLPGSDGWISERELLIAGLRRWYGIEHKG